jgi:hypothetical protein
LGQSGQLWSIVELFEIILRKMGSIHRFMDVHSMEAKGILQDFEKDMRKTASKAVH